MLGGLRPRRGQRLGGEVVAPELVQPRGERQVGVAEDPAGGPLHPVEHLVAVAALLRRTVGVQLLARLDEVDPGEVVRRREAEAVGEEHAVRRALLPADEPPLAGDRPAPAPRTRGGLTHATATGCAAGMVAAHHRADAIEQHRATDHT